MGGIVLDASKVKSYVLPNLTKSTNTMQEAYSTSQSLRNTLPSGFSYRSTVNDIVNQIYNIKREISDINKMISKKIEKAKTIEKKNDNRASSIVKAASNIGTSLAAVTGATVKSTVKTTKKTTVTTKKTKSFGEKILDTGAKVCKSFVSGVKGFFSGVGNFFSSGAKKVANGVKSIWKKFTGSIKSIAKGVANVGKTIFKAGAKVVKGTVSGIKKIGSGIWNGLKKVGSKVVSGVKTAAKWVGNKAKSAWNWVGDKFNKAKNWVCKAVKDTGAWISKTAKSAWSWITGAAKTAWKHMKKIGASFVNGVLALTKGVVKLVEAIGDLAVMLGSGIASVGTALWDVGKGICTGNWDWGATKGLWKGTKSVVAYDWTNKCIFDPLYESKFGKWLDANAYAPFKSDGMACKILEGVGYVAGVIAISVVTFGAGGVAIGSSATIAGVTVNAGAVAITAAAAGIGKYTEEEWNKNSLSITYGGQELGLTIDYSKYQEIEKLGDGQSTTITQQFTGEDGKPIELKFTITKNGDTYSVKDSNGNAVGFNGIKESSTVGGMLMGTIKGLGDGLKAYTAVSTIGNVQQFVSAASKVGGGNALKGTLSIIKDYGAKESMKTVVKTSAKQTFKDVGFYIDSGTHIYTDVKNGIQTGEWNLLKTGAKIAGAYGVNFLGNLGGNINNGMLDTANRLEVYNAKQAEYDELFSTPEAQVYLDRNEIAADHNIKQREYEELFSTPEAQAYLNKNELMAKINDVDNQILNAEKLGDFDEVTRLQKQKSLLNQEYYSTMYGVDNVSHTSGIDVEGHNGTILTRTVDVNGQKIKTNLTDSELQRYGKNNLQYGVPEDIKYLKTDVDGKLIVNWDLAPDRGAVPGTRKNTTISKGSQFDRYGNPNGNFVGKMELDSSGQYQGVNYDARSLPYTEGSQTYTKYTVLKDINSESLSQAVSNLPKDSELYNVIKAQVTNDGFDFIELPDGSVSLNVTEAKIAAAFGHNGGGIQYEIPVRTNYLKELGFIDF